MVPQSIFIGTLWPSWAQHRSWEGRGRTNLISLGGFDRYDLYDVSPVATETGRQTAQARGLKAANFVCGDIYEAVLPDGGYDVITFFAALHHMGDLEAILQKCNRMLAPGGVLWAAEYVGPDRFQFPDKHTAFAKALYRALDPEIKLPFEPELRFPSAEEVIAADPTESIHPSEIQSTMRSIWPNMEFIGTYGTLMFILSWCLNYNAWYDTDQGREIVQHGPGYRRCNDRCRPLTSLFCLFGREERMIGSPPS